MWQLDSSTLFIGKNLFHLVSDDKVYKGCLDIPGLGIFDNYKLEGCVEFENEDGVIFIISHFDKIVL